MAEAPETVKNPRLQFRLPREDKAIIVPFDDPPPLLDQAAAVLGQRLVETRMGFKLDGKIVNVAAVVRAAGLKFKDEQ